MTRARDAEIRTPCDFHLKFKMKKLNIDGSEGTYLKDTTNLIEI